VDKEDDRGREQHNTGRFCVVLLEEEKREGQGRKRKKEEKKGESGSEKSGRVEVLTQHALRKIKKLDLIQE
jgi:hypothetical protein